MKTPLSNQPLSGTYENLRSCSLGISSVNPKIGCTLSDIEGFNSSGGETDYGLTMKNYRETKISIIEWGDESFKLKTPIEIEGFFNDGLWEIKNKFLNIICMAFTWDECLEELNEDFFFLVETYAKSPDEKLSIGALELKRKLLKLIEKGAISDLN